jgi:hypothetical protein
MTMLRVRVEVADVPGALAGLTAALAALRVDVATIDVLEIDGRTVVDEMLVRLPGGVTPQEVRDVLRMAGADVLSCGTAVLGSDAAVTAFDLARSVLAGSAEARGAALARVAYAEVGAVLAVDQARAYPLAQRALLDGVPASGPGGAGASPLSLRSGWVLWVAPQVPEPTMLAVVARPLNVRFSATEAARLRAFATLLDALERVER